MVASVTVHEAAILSIPPLLDEASWTSLSMRSWPTVT